MANTVTISNTVVGQKECVVYMTLAYVDTATEDFTLFDSSAIAALVGAIDPLSSNIVSIYGSVSSDDSTARAWLEWDATADVVALDIPVATNPTKANFRCIGGLPNQGGSGKTGDINFNATGLGAGDLVTIVLHVKRT